VVTPNVADREIALTFPPADQFRAVMAFSLRKGGQSPPPFDSLNFSVGQGDLPENVRCNLAILGGRIGIDPERIVTCRQMHGDHIHVTEAVPESPPRADAIVTPRPNIFPAIKTADCVPILILDPVLGIAAAVHAGWRGTVLGISRKTVELMQDRFGSDPSELLVGMGPGIGPCCYEVDDAVVTPFRKAFPDAERFITEHDPTTKGTETDSRQSVTRSGKGTACRAPTDPSFPDVDGNLGTPQNEPNSRKSYHLDLAAANRFELAELGVPERNIYGTDLCSACHKDLFFSHRRDGAKSGRHIAVVGFRG